MSFVGHSQPIIKYMVDAITNGRMGTVSDTMPIVDMGRIIKVLN